MEKNPERVRAGRLGALTCHARGRTNTKPARAAWESRLAAEFGIARDLPDNERQRRMEFALKAKMTALANARWHGKPKRSRSKPVLPDLDKPWCVERDCEWFPNPHYH